nr:alpha-ketoglutarate-dependent dioxygenase alkb like 3 [Quercus suber]
MEAFVSRKRRKVSPTPATTHVESPAPEDTESTDFKLAVLASLHPHLDSELLLDYLLAHDGSIEQVTTVLSRLSHPSSSQRRSIATNYQSSLSAFAGIKTASSLTKPLTKKGKTLHLFSPDDIEANTPCSIIHNFLPFGEADALLRELLLEVPLLRKDTFQLFDKTVESPHTSRFYVDSSSEALAQKTEYVYNGNYCPDVAESTPEMLKVSAKVEEAVNLEITRRTREIYPGGKKLMFQSSEPWKPNVSFVNCYDGAKQSVGYHSDHLTYLGPRAVIGSLSLGVAREFRVRRIVPRENASSADAQGQIAIHLPHNSLLVMHAEMQEEWKHSIAPCQTVEPHPLAGNKRLNITYRCYAPYLHPKYTPRCRCNVPTVLRCVQKSTVTRGRYMWMCHRNFTPGKSSCSYFSWAEFDENGKPPWTDGYKGNRNVPLQANEIQSSSQKLVGVPRRHELSASEGAEKDDLGGGTSALSTS